MQAYAQVESEQACVRFGRGGAFQCDLKKRADAYFEDAGSARRDVPGMYLKSAAIIGWFWGSWALLVFAATSAWQGVLCAMSLGLSIAAIGMGVQHDANHGGYSSHAWVNRFFGFTLDWMGVSGFFWKQKHNIIHHTFTNVEGIDFDLDFGIIARLTPDQPRRPWQRFQHVYIWFLYGFLLPKWVFHDDFILFKERRAGPHALSPMRRIDVALFFWWKVFFVAWSLVIPAFFHPIWQVAIFHLVAAFTLGVTLSTVFQLAHCVAEAEFPRPAPAGETLCDDWAAHQVETTVDFAHQSAVLTWFLGGLNYQVEHHLFPKVCHLHYPALARIVREVSAKHGVRYRENTTLGGAIASHYRHLKRLGLRAT